MSTKQTLPIIKLHLEGQRKNVKTKIKYLLCYLLFDLLMQAQEQIFTIKLVKTRERN